MKSLLLALASVFAMSATADSIVSVYTAITYSMEEVQDIVEGINSGRIYVSGCSGNQKVMSVDVPTPENGRKHTFFHVRCRD